MNLNELVTAFGEKIGIELAVEDGVCTLGVDNMVVTLQEMPEIDSLATYGEIGEVPPEDPTALYAALLEANYLFQGTSGATLSRNHETGKISLCRVDKIDQMDADSFFTMLETFANTLESWRNIVANYRGSIEGAPAAALPAGADMPMRDFNANGFIQV